MCGSKSCVRERMQHIYGGTNMKFEVEEAVNGFTVKVNDGQDLHVARTPEEVAEIVVKTLGPQGGKTPKAKKARKLRGPNKKKPAVNSDALAGLT